VLCDLCAELMPRRCIEAHMPMCPANKAPCDLCGKLVSLCSLPAHRKACMAPCQWCKKAIHRSEVQDHEALCGILCDLCGQRYQCSKENHLNTCPNVLVRCKKCNERLPRHELRDHVCARKEAEVKPTLVDCPNTWCDIRVYPEDLPQHIEECKVTEAVIKPISKAKLSRPGTRPKAPDCAYHPYPVCNGYCLRRAKGKAAERTSWAMMAPVHVHWKGLARTKLKKGRPKLKPGQAKPASTGGPTFSYGHSPGKVYALPESFISSRPF